MKKIFIFWLIVLIFSGCGQKEKQETRHRIQDTIKISGSITAYPCLQLLADAFKKEFHKVNIIFLPGTHSAGGIKGVYSGDLDIGICSRLLNKDEEKFELIYYPIANDGIVIASNNNIKIKKLTSQQIRDIYSGKIKNWKELGGPNTKIIVLDRNEDESAKIIMRQYVFGKDLKITNTAISMSHESDMVKGVSGTPDSIGYFSLGYAITHKLNITPISLDGITPLPENILSGKYKIIRLIGIVTNKNPKESVKKFIDFIYGEETKGILIKNGYAPTK